MQFTPISDHIGVRVDGLDLSQPIAAGDRAELKEALAKHKMLLFRHGPVNDDEHVQLLASLGRIRRDSPSGSAYAISEATLEQQVRQPPDVVAQRTVEAMEAGDFYVFPDPESEDTLRSEFEQVLAAFRSAAPSRT